MIEDGYGGATWPVQHYRELESLQERWRPYVYFRQKPFSGQTISIDQDGLRLTWQPPPVPVGPGEPRAVQGPDARRFVALGIWGAERSHDPLDHRPQAPQPGYRVELRNLAEIGYVSTQEVVALLRELQSGYRPDLVIFYDGVNDTTSALLEGEAAVTTNERNRRASSTSGNRRPGWGAALLARLIEDSASYRFAQVIGRRLTGSAATGGLPSADRAGELAAKVVSPYRPTSRSSRNWAGASGSMPSITGSRSCSTSEALTPYEQEEATRFAWSRGVLPERAMTASRPPPSCETIRASATSATCSPDSDRLIFIDYCHTTESANAIIAQAIAGDIEQVPRNGRHRPLRDLP